MQVKANINDFIKVKLTEYGKDIYDHSNDSLMIKPENEKIKKWLEPIPLEYDDEGYVQFQLWNFMHIFGKHMFNGAEPVIENNNIIILSARREIEATLNLDAK